LTSSKDLQMDVFVISHFLLPAPFYVLLIGRLNLWSGESGFGCYGIRWGKS